MSDIPKQLSMDDDIREIECCIQIAHTRLQRFISLAARSSSNAIWCGQYCKRARQLCEDLSALNEEYRELMTLIAAESLALEYRLNSDVLRLIVDHTRGI